MIINLGRHITDMAIWITLMKNRGREARVVPHPGSILFLYSLMKDTLKTEK